MATGSTNTPCRIAICDDVESYRKVLALVFKLEPDIEIVGEASDGREAIDLVSSVDVDVLILDIAMPLMDGIEALPTIRTRSPDTKVIMLTGFGTKTIREQALSLGACRYFEKGLTPPELVAAVRDVCACAE